MSINKMIDLRFQALGNILHVDHGFALYSAVSKILPIFHSVNNTGMSLVRGRYIGDGLLSIAPMSSLVFRLPVAQMHDFINLAGKLLNIGGHSLQIGTPSSHALVPAATLYAHLVTTKNGHDQARFESETARQLEQLACRGRMIVGRRRTFKVHGRQVVGYSVLVSELTAEESIILQEKGLGGRRKMGCGFFQPWQVGQ